MTSQTPKMMMLYCHLFGTHFDFSVKISAQHNVDQLRDAICTKYPQRFGLEAPNLRLWKWNKSGEVKESDLNDRSVLKVMEILDEVFDDGTKPKCFHIIIKVFRK